MEEDAAAAKLQAIKRGKCAPHRSRQPRACLIRCLALHVRHKRSVVRQMGRRCSCCRECLSELARTRAIVSVL